MDFHYRKLLIDKPGEEKKENDCGDVYCSTPFQSPPPPPLPPPPPPLSHHTSSMLVLMLCILGVGFVLVSYFSVVRYRSRNFRTSNSQPIHSSREDFLDENHGPIVDHPIWYIRTIGLQQSVIDSIAVFKYKKDEKLIEGSDCSVCLSEFQEDESLRLLPKCSHAFHIHCIDTWLRSHQNCPLCRAPVVSNNNVIPTQGEASLNGLDPVEENSAETETESVENGGETESLDEEGENTATRGQSIGSLPTEEELEQLDGTRKKKIRVKSDLALYGVKLDEEMERVRRSISLDTNSTSMANLDFVVVEGESSSSSKDEGCLDTNTENNKMKQNLEMISKSGNKNSSIYKLMKSSSLGRSLQKMPISMKRSFSTTGKSGNQ